MDPVQIQRMFSRLAPEYDRFNRWSSLGLDSRWRAWLAGELSPGQRVLDLGCGTGALACLVYRRVAPGRHPGGSRGPASNGLLDSGFRRNDGGESGRVSAGVVGLDFSLEMLRRAARAGEGPCWVQAGAHRLPFRSESFDAVVSAYVLRNLRRAGILEEALRETCRVLRPEGRLLFLDLTRPRRGPVRWGHRLYLRAAVPLVGRWLFGDRWPGDYLDDSMDALDPPETLGPVFAAAGFGAFEVRPAWGGIVSLFSGRKIP